MRLLLSLVVLGVAIAAAVPSALGATREVVIVTSFPKELFEAYKKAFEGARPGVRVVIKPQQTNAAITYLRETRARPDADIFWASAVDAFQVLKADSLLEGLSLPEALLKRIPKTIGTFPIHDPDGHFFGFAVSGYGLMWNTRYLALHKLSPPKEWTDLADPRYHGHLVISAPSRSGTTHLTIEVILQAYGWDKAWALLLQMGGNMGSITERSFGVPEAVISGQYGIGVVIDFFGLSAIASGHPVGFAVSGYGLMWNTRYLALHKLSPPKEWTDLTDPRYHGHLVISAPSRSGTTHLTIEVILQAYGWDKGWALLLQMGGNMGSITERSFGVPEAVISGQYGIGVVIDFFGLSAIASGHPIGFAYPSLTSVVPASVGAIKSGPNPENARAFVEYLLSDQGQLLLFSPEIGRLPVVPDLYARAPASYPNLFTMKLGGVNFDSKLSTSRRNVVNSLYDHLITFRHAELKAAWAAIFAAEGALAKAKAAGRSLPQAEAALAEARKLGTSMPVDASRASDKEVNAAFKDKPDIKSKLETEWDNFAKSSYVRARELAERASAGVK